MERKLNEECGVFAIRTAQNDAVGTTYNALLALQHRGQQSAGIAALDGTAIACHKAPGLTTEAFSAADIDRLPASSMAIGHVRYAASGGSLVSSAQPIVVEYLRGRLALANNGRLYNAEALRAHLASRGYDFEMPSDSAVIAALIAMEALAGHSLEKAVARAARQLQGAFSFVVLTSLGQLIAVRDARGFRPLCIGRSGDDFAVASESCALSSTGFTFERDIAPGEMVVIDPTGDMRAQMVLPRVKKGLCIFEYVYFARPDSDIDGLSVYQARFNAGRVLAKEYPVKADIVCGVPDSGVEAAQGYAAQSGLPYTSGFVKNRYIGRSFIYPTQGQREDAVRLKLNPLQSNLRDKRVVMVDDSIVRGTTSARIIKSLKRAGAREVHVRISSPPFRHVCHFGTAIDSRDDLIANRMTLNEIREHIGADSLGFISVEGLKRACKSCRIGMCTGCFTGSYPMQVE